MLFEDNLSTLLMVLFLILGFAVGALAVIYFQRRRGGRTAAQDTADYKAQEERRRREETIHAHTEKVRDFMEFDSVQDDMIVQDKGQRFCMVLRCMGINYDLMSENEMLAVEEGFASFLNTLKFPIQLYVQSRTLDLSAGISEYKARLENLKTESDKYIESVQRAKQVNQNLSTSQRQQLDYEVKKRRNLLDYGNDIVNYIEKMSSNRNILQRKYYMVVSYETLEMGLTNNFSDEEAKDVAYSELYTRCKTLQGAISACGIETEILRSEDLAELLFVAYNKDDAAVYSIREAMRNGIYRLYSTATSVIEKKKAALDAKLKEDALNEAQNALRSAIDSIRNSSFVDISGLTEEEQFEDDTKREAMQIILDNQENFDPEVVDKALEDLNAGMHQPLVSEQELQDAAAGAAAEAQNDDNTVPIYDGTSGPINPDDLINTMY